MSIEDLRTAAVALAPGFIALKVFYLFGAQRPRSQWEWIIWSVFVSLPLDAFADWSAPHVANWTGLALDLSDAPIRVGAAVLAGVGASLLWRLAGASRWGWLRDRQRDVTDSAFDIVIEDAVRNKRPVEIVVRDGDETVQYRGRAHTFARESAQVQPWMYLTSVHERRNKRKFVEVPGTHGIMFHRDRVERIRILDRPEPAASGPPSGTASHR